MNLQRIENTREMWLNPIDEPEDTRPQCRHCGVRFNEQEAESDDGYCSESHWHLDRISEVKKQILTWIEQGYSEKRIAQMMKLYWFYWMTDSTVERWKRAIAHKFEEVEKA